MVEKHYLENELEGLLQSDASLWKFLQAGSLDGVWYWDLEKQDREWMSPEFWRLFGIDPTTRSHDPAEWQDIIYQDDLQVALDNFNKHCADPNHPYDQIVRYRHADGSTVWVRCRGIAIRDDSGKPLRMLGAHNDVTALKRAESSALADKRAAEAANEELRSFAYSVSHDLKSPANTLCMLMSELAALSAIRDDDESKAIVDMGAKTANRMRELIENVLDYTQVVGESAGFELISLNDLLADTLSHMKSDIEDAEATIDVGKLPEIQGNETHLSLLFQNLIGNALKFRRTDTPLSISIRAEQSDCLEGTAITVADNGIGIAKKYQDRIFEMFHRLHQKEDYDGCGLGLSLCRRIAIHHGGQISLRSSPGQGAAFTVDLPARQS